MCHACSLGVASALLANGANVQETNRLGLSALALTLILAGQGRDPRLERGCAACQLLLDAGAQVGAKESELRCM